MDSLLISRVESSYLKRDVRKLESSQKDESCAQSDDSSKVHRKPKCCNCCNFRVKTILGIATLLSIQLVTQRH